MLSIERIKNLIEEPDMSDAEASEIRAGLYDLAKIIFEKWLLDRKKISSANGSEDTSELENRFDK